jgi:hypothetical protein
MGIIGGVMSYSRWNKRCKFYSYYDGDSKFTINKIKEDTIKLEYEDVISRIQHGFQDILGELSDTDCENLIDILSAFFEDCQNDKDNEMINDSNEEDMKIEKLRICVDFDGVIHSYKSGWKGADVIPDEPVEGAFEALTTYLETGYAVAVYSSRSGQEGGIEAMKNWFLQHGFEELGALEFPEQKPPAVFYIDDNGFKFEGKFPSSDYIENWKPWYKR